MLGLGHLGVSLALARELAAGPDDGALVVTGSPAFGGLRVPIGVDVMKVPTAPPGPDSPWSKTELRPPAALGVDVKQITALRADLYRAAVEHVEPDVVIVDYRPLGRDGDLVPALQLARESRRCTVALGIWDSDDAPEALRAQWTPELMASASEFFDLAIVYGPPAEDDVRLAALRDAGIRVEQVGFVSTPPATVPPADLEPGYLLVTVGGGVDGFATLDAVLAAIRLRALPVHSVMVAGPLMPEAEFDRLRDSAEGLDVELFSSRSDPQELLAGARAVVSMAGYCTATEVLASGKPALMVPRSVPRAEQLNRARRLAADGLVQLLVPEELSPGSMRAAIDQLLARGAREPRILSGAGDVRRVMSAAVQSRPVLPASQAHSEAWWASEPSLLRNADSTSSRP